MTNQSTQNKELVKIKDKEYLLEEITGYELYQSRWTRSPGIWISRTYWPDSKTLRYSSNLVEYETELERDKDLGRLRKLIPDLEKKQ